MGTKTKPATSSSSSSSAPKGPTIPERVAELEARVAEVEHRLGIDHAVIAQDRAESQQRGVDAAPLSEPPATADGDA